MPITSSLPTMRSPDDDAAAASQGYRLPENYKTRILAAPRGFMEKGQARSRSRANERFEITSLSPTQHFATGAGNDVPKFSYVTCETRLEAIFSNAYLLAIELRIQIKFYLREKLVLREIGSSWLKKECTREEPNNTKLKY